MLKEFVAFPAPEIAVRTLASFLFGEPATIKSESAQDEIDLLVEENHLHSTNQEAAVSCAVEGEIYYKVDWDEEISDYAIIHTVPAALSFPLFRYGRLIEIAFVCELADEKAEKEHKVVRHVEIRLMGTILHRVFLGTKDTLGVEVDPAGYEDTYNLPEELDTGIDDTLVRHVPFWRASYDPHGLSVFRGKESLIEAMHALYSQDQHDAEMAKRRIAISNAYLKRDRRGRPTFDRQLDVFELSDEAAGAIGAESKPVHPIEFTDSTIMGQRIAQRFDEFLLSCGIAPQSAGRDVSGTAESGTARKLAQSLTIQTVATAGRYFSPAIRDIVTLALEIGSKHLNRPAAAEPGVQVTLADGFAADPREDSEIIRSLSEAQAISLETKVKMVHPEWDDQEVQKEVDRIQEEQGLQVPEPLRNVPPKAPGTIPPTPEEEVPA